MSHRILLSSLLITLSGIIFSLLISTDLSWSQTSAFKVDDNSSVNLLNLNTDAGFLLKGIYGTGTIPTTGAGTRLMWHPAKAALRAGYVSGTQWDDVNIGYYSFAAGQSTTASGVTSTAMGNNTSASGSSSTAMGDNTSASGSSSTAMGNNTTASGSYSTAMGYLSTASGIYSMALGSYVSSNSYSGAFVLGDFSTASVLNANQADQMSMRFDGGYRLFSDEAMTDGLFISASGNVGLGATIPGAKLHVVGQVKITGGSPSAGKVLTSDASGLATWVTPTTADITAVGSMTTGAAFADATADNDWLGLGSSAGRIEFDDLATDQVNILDARVGIGTSTPSADLHVSGTEGVIAQGTLASGAALSLGGGTRMHWYPYKAAFRAGRALGLQWDDVNIGDYSFAAGQSTTASGYSSTAMGYQTTASGWYSTAMGNNTSASGSSSTAMGNNTSASGSSSTAMGYGSTASGSSSTAMGNNTSASGSYSTAMGYYVSTDSYNGSFIIGDGSTTTTTDASAVNQMTMRFNGGYRLYSNTALTAGVYMNSGVSGWTSYCDRNKKENFQSVDGEVLLEKIREMPITEWNYKNTDASVRYIGPMAQDFWQAFHLGGTDSLGINSISIDGVNMAAIQALEKRTREQKNEIDLLQAQLKELKRDNIELYSRLDRIESLLKNNGNTLYSGTNHAHLPNK